MALSLPKNSSRGVVGLDIDGRYVAAAEVSAGKVGRVASMELPPGLVEEGEVVDADALASELKAFFKANGLGRTVRLGIANKQIVVRQIEIPHIANERDRDAAIRFQATEAIAMPLEEAVLDYHLLEQVTEGPSVRDRVVVVAARAPMIDQLVNAARGAGLKVDGIDLSAFALVRALAEPTAEGDPGQARVYCHLGAIANLAIATGSMCGFTRSLTTGLDAEHADDAAVAATVADEIQLSLNFHQSQTGARPVSEIVLSGPGAEREGLVERLEALTGHPITIAEPFGKLHPPQLRDGEDPRRLTVAAGLALGSGKAVNLVPNRARFAAEPVKNSSVLVVAALVLLLGAAIGYVTLGNQINAHKSDLAEAKAATDVARSKGGELKPFERFAAIKQARVSAVKEAATGRVDWERMMRELSLLLPDGTWITEANASAAGTPGGSEGATPLPGEEAASGSPAVQLLGCSTSQRRVAVMLVRLKQMHQVADVTLKESAEEESDSGGSTSDTGGGGDSGCGPGRFKFDATVKFLDRTQADTGADQPKRIPTRLGGGQ